MDGVPNFGGVVFHREFASKDSPGFLFGFVDDSFCVGLSFHVFGFGIVVVFMFTPLVEGFLSQFHGCVNFLRPPDFSFLTSAFWDEFLGCIHNDFVKLFEWEDGFDFRSEFGFTNFLFNFFSITIPVRFLVSPTSEGLGCGPTRFLSCGDGGKSGNVVRAYGIESGPVDVPSPFGVMEGDVRTAVLARAGRDSSRRAVVG